MRTTPQELAAFVRGLEDDLLLPALWLVRRAGLGEILSFYEPDKQALESINDRLLAQNRPLYDFVQERMKEN